MGTLLNRFPVEEDESLITCLVEAISDQDGLLELQRGFLLRAVADVRIVHERLVETVLSSQLVKGLSGDTSVAAWLDDVRRDSACNGNPRIAAMLRTLTAERTGPDDATAAANMEQDDVLTRPSQDEQFREDVQAALDKLSPAEVEASSKQISGLGAVEPQQLRVLVDIVSTQALASRDSIDVLAQLCVALAPQLPSFELQDGVIVRQYVAGARRSGQGGDNDGSTESGLTKEIITFKACLREQCREVFGGGEERRGWWRHADGRERVISFADFVRMLFARDVVDEDTVHEFIVDLLQSEEEDTIRCLCDLLRRCGTRLDRPGADGKMDELIRGMEVLAEKVGQKLGGDARAAMLREIMELRGRGWTVTEEVEVSRHRVCLDGNVHGLGRHVLGRSTIRGAIKKLQAEARRQNGRVELIEDQDTGMTKLKISCPIDEIQMWQKDAASVAEMAQSSRLIAIPSKKVGLVVGKDGTTVNRLVDAAEAKGAILELIQNRFQRGPAEVHISGPDQDVLDALVVEVRRTARLLPLISTTIGIPSDRVGVVVGRGGATIKRLEEIAKEKGATLELIQERKQGAAEVSISGPSRDAINELEAEVRRTANLVRVAQVQVSAERLNRRPVTQSSDDVDQEESEAEPPAASSPAALTAAGGAPPTSFADHLVGVLRAREAKGDAAPLFAAQAGSMMRRKAAWEAEVKDASGTGSVKEFVKRSRGKLEWCAGGTGKGGDAIRLPRSEAEALMAEAFDKAAGAVEASGEGQQQELGIGLPDTGAMMTQLSIMEDEEFWRNCERLDQQLSVRQVSQGLDDPRFIPLWENMGLRLPTSGAPDDSCGFDALLKLEFCGRKPNPTSRDWGEAVRKTWHRQRLGRWIFSPMLKRVRQTFIATGKSDSSPFLHIMADAAQDVRKEELDADTAPHSMKLEADLLLKELGIGRREREIAVWSGHVTAAGALPLVECGQGHALVPDDRKLVDDSGGLLRISCAVCFLSGSTGSGVAGESWLICRRCLLGSEHQKSLSEVSLCPDCHRRRLAGEGVWVTLPIFEEDSQHLQTGSTPGRIRVREDTVDLRGLAIIPEELRAFGAKIRSLRLGGRTGNSFTRTIEFPAWMHELRNVEFLSFAGCSQLERLPGWISSLTRLRELDVSRCTRLRELSADHEAMTLLERINLSGCTSFSISSLLGLPKVGREILGWPSVDLVVERLVTSCPIQEITKIVEEEVWRSDIDGLLLKNNALLRDESFVQRAVDEKAMIIAQLVYQQSESSLARHFLLHETKLPTSRLIEWRHGADPVLGTLRGHSDYVRSVAYSPDGKHIVSGSEDNTVKVWDSQTGKAVRVLVCHRPIVCCCVHCC